MYIILSQRIDFKSDYDDQIFEFYHFPKKYRSQINTGDKFIYNQGDRKDSKHRYYFGCGEIGEISSDNHDGFYAKIINSGKFENNVGIHFERHFYFESIDFSSVRRRPTPPWQSAIRKLSKKAYDSILLEAGNIISFRNQ